MRSKFLSNSTSSAYLIVFVVILLLCGYGYVENIVNVVSSTRDIDTRFVVRCIGIFVAPLGIIMGFI